APWPWARSSSGTRGSFTERTAMSWRASCSSFLSYTWPCCLRRCWSITGCKEPYGAHVCPSRRRRGGGWVFLQRFAMVADFSVFRRFFLRAGVAAVASLALAACEKAPSFHNTDVSVAALVADLSRPDFDGRPRALQDFKGKVLVVFFGFVQCPDVCPTTLADLAQVKAQLGPDGDRLQVVFVTVDPERDT